VVKVLDFQSAVTGMTQWHSG